MESPGPSEMKKHVIHSRERNIIGNVLEACLQEKECGELLAPLKSPQKRTSVYTKCALRTVGRIAAEKHTSPEGKLVSPKKRPGRQRTLVDDFDRGVICRLIENFYVRRKITPSVPKILQAVKQSIDFKLGRESLRKLMREMGFRWAKSQNGRKVLIERQNIVDWRGKYLQQIKAFREKNYEIFFLDETWLDTNLVMGKCWQGPGVMGVTSSASGSGRYIVVGIGSEKGFLPGSQLVFKAGSSTGDYHGQMNGENFTRWIMEKVLPNLPPASVIVMDNAPYHSMQLNKAPTSSSNKTEMVDWLLKNGMTADMSMRRYALLDMVKAVAPKDKTFKIDQLLRAHDHIVLRLPHYMCELNPIELAWAKLKRFVRERNVAGDLSMTQLRELTYEGKV